VVHKARDQFSAARTGGSPLRTTDAPLSTTGL